MDGPDHMMSTSQGPTDHAAFDGREPFFCRCSSRSTSAGLDQLLGNALCGGGALLEAGCGRQCPETGHHPTGEVWTKSSTDSSTSPPPPMWGRVRRLTCREKCVAEHNGNGNVNGLSPPNNQFLVPDLPTYKQEVFK